MTTAANHLIRAPGHQRMPAIIHIERESSWLKTSSSLTDVLNCLSPFPDRLMNAFPISTKVNDPMQNDLSVIQPIGEPVCKENKAPIFVRKKDKYIPSDITWADQ
ncbi:MAG: SOS response-associated peptidase family protein, partial [Prolixibacteraceae bacterium]